MTSVFNLLPALHVAYTPDKPKKQKQKPETGYKLRKHWHNDSRVLLSRQQVLEARWLHEIAHWTIERVAAFYGLSRIYTVKLLDYTVRSKIGPPKIEDFPAGYCPAMPKQEAQLLLDYLLTLRIDHIALSDDSGLIDVVNNPGGLLGALREASGHLPPLNSP